jgi:hypothetical protein
VPSEPRVGADVPPLQRRTESGARGSLIDAAQGGGRRRSLQLLKPSGFQKRPFRRFGSR